eukprot:10851047-Alexandrium_andersonii.AAC.1
MHTPGTSGLRQGLRESAQALPHGVGPAVPAAGVLTASAGALPAAIAARPVSYTHLRAHETSAHL